MKDIDRQAYIIDEAVFERYCRQYSVVPVIKQRKLEHQVLDICQSFDNCYQMLLHSPRNGRYTFYATRQIKSYTGVSTGIEVEDLLEGQTTVYDGDPLKLLEEQFLINKAPKIADIPPFYGGLIGYFSYDLARSIEVMPDQTLDDLGLPLFFLTFVTDGIAIDHLHGILYLFANRTADESYRDVIERIEEMEQQIITGRNQRTMTYQREQSHQVEARKDRAYHKESFSQPEFCHAADRIIEYIKAGDVFQVNLSLRQGVETDADPFAVYAELVHRNTSPYMAYIETPQFAIASSSPELLVKIREGVIETRPIAGTRSRGTTEMQEQELMKELLSNEKELAEHIMLVDLERNDLGRVSEYGSVEVNELLALEKYSHVIHLVSNVRGKLRSDKNLFDALRAIFPGGTITGAPKVRTMEIIEELEPVKRGVYTGSIGWLGFQQEMELNIVIRTAVFKDGWAFVQAGAGIVYDSIPEREYKESLKKAKAVWDILQDQALEEV